MHMILILAVGKFWCRAQNLSTCMLHHHNYSSSTLSLGQQALHSDPTTHRSSVAAILCFSLQTKVIALQVANLSSTSDKLSSHDFNTLSECIYLIICLPLSQGRKSFCALQQILFSLPNSDSPAPTSSRADHTTNSPHKNPFSLKGFLSLALNACKHNTHTFTAPLSFCLGVCLPLAMLSRTQHQCCSCRCCLQSWETVATCSSNCLRRGSWESADFVRQLCTGHHPVGEGKERCVLGRNTADLHHVVLFSASAPCTFKEEKRIHHGHLKPQNLIRQFCLFCSGALHTHTRERAHHSHSKAVDLTRQWRPGAAWAHHGPQQDKKLKITDRLGRARHQCSLERLGVALGDYKHLEDQRAGAQKLRR